MRGDLRISGARVSAIVILVVAGLMAGCHGSGAAPPDGILAIEGSDNAGMSVAARGERVAVTWAATRNEVTNAFAAVSHDGGRTFAAPVRVNDVDGDVRIGGEQPTRVAVGDDVFVAWSARNAEGTRIRLARSTDEGRRFTPAITVHRQPLAGTRGWTSLAVDRDNLPHVLWLDNRSTEPVAAAPMDATAHGMHHASGKSAPQNIFQATWDRSGQETEVRVASDVCFCCKTSVTTDADGVVYAAWRHLFPGNVRDIAMARSNDAGRTFAAPVRVSEDDWKLDVCPEDGPAMVVDTRHVIHIVWPTLVNSTPFEKGIFYAFSVDGGRSFSPRQRIDGPDATRASHPQLSLDGDGVALVWDAMVADRRQVRLRRVTSAPSARTWTPEIGAVVTVNQSGLGAHPAAATTTAGLIVAWTDRSPPHSTIRWRLLPR